MEEKYHPSITNEPRYNELKQKGLSSTQSAHISNTPSIGTNNEVFRPLEERNTEDLRRMAKDKSVENYEDMNRSELMAALRSIDDSSENP